MPPPPKPTITKAAVPVYSKVFDAWNSSSTGHQRPDNTPGTGWRESRNKKLNSQFQAGNSGGARLSDTWGAGSEDWDEREKVLVPKSIKERKGRTVMDLLVGKTNKDQAAGQMSSSACTTANNMPATQAILQKLQKDEQVAEIEDQDESFNSAGGIFAGVVVYVNGSTYPIVSDHKLKHIITANGGHMSLHLGRRKVTHVILGRASGGGGLSGGKLEKEIKKLRGCQVHFVNAEWIMESLKAGKRLPEARFKDIKMAPSRQGSVYTTFLKTTASDNAVARLKTEP